MARPSKNAHIDLGAVHDVTAGLIERLVCPDSKAQAFMRDAKSPSLRVRVTAAGAKSFVFEAKLNRKTIRRTIGDVRAWSIDAARAEANRLRVTVDGGDDPREIRRAKAKARADLFKREVAEAVNVSEAWNVYLAERILLVTSALHMPRALALFKAQGLGVTPAPTDFEAGQEPPSGMLAWLPDAGALNGSALAMKELVGKWVGR